jgi:hypothetical protein
LAPKYFAYGTDGDVTALWRTGARETSFLHLGQHHGSFLPAEAKHAIEVVYGGTRSMTPDPNIRPIFDPTSISDKQGKTSRYTSFSTKRRGAEKVGKGENRFINKVLRDRLVELRDQGAIRIWEPDDVYDAMKTGGRRISSQAGNI